MTRKTDRIYTSHVGSLPRPKDVLDMMHTRLTGDGDPVDDATYQMRMTEAANPRHEHDYHVFENVKLPDGRAIMPGVITHASNIVEHEELIAEWLVRFAKLVGRENVIAGADCGFSSQACYHTEVHPTVIWAKFQSMRKGADLATKALW